MKTGSLSGFATDGVELAGKLREAAARGAIVQIKDRDLIELAESVEAFELERISFEQAFDGRHREALAKVFEVSEAHALDKARRDWREDMALRWLLCVGVPLLIWLMVP